MVLFYTDLMLFMGFMMLICFMCCFGGDTSGGMEVGDGVGGGAEIVTA